MAHHCSLTSLSAAHPAGGVYYKGFVNTVRPAPVPGVSTPEEVAAYDPWESVRVEWDVTARDEEKFQVPLAAFRAVCRPPMQVITHCSHACSTSWSCCCARPLD
jgi:hypothetical protein